MAKYFGIVHVVVITCALLTAVSSIAASTETTEFKEILELAKSGHAEAQAAAGFRYISGSGVARSPGEAYRWYAKAAAQQHPGALFSLGSLYFNGDGVDRSAEQAAKYYRRAADLGHPGAMDNLGVFYREGIVFEANDQEALKWFERAAEAGHPRAPTNAGWMYANGRGTPKDFTKAADWYRKGQRAGDVVAVYNLGLFYALGQGVDPDPEQAMRYIAYAAARGHEGAIADAATLASRLAVATTTGRAGIYAVPTSADSPLGQLAEGTQVHILAEPNDEWVEIYLSDGHQTGFVMRRHLKPATP